MNAPKNKMDTRHVVIDVAVGGRFHSDYLMTALLKAGFEPNLITSYPKRRFPNVPKGLITSFMVPELGYRALKKMGWERLGEQFKMATFGRFLAMAGPQATQGVCPVVVAWSSFALERFQKDHVSKKILVRDSTHIIHQTSLLVEEYDKLKMIYSPDPVCVNRELQEYELADKIVVLSKFAKESFLKRGSSPEKIDVVPLGVNTSVFKPSLRSNSNGTLQLVYFGTLSIRKGIHYLLEATSKFPKNQVHLSLVGPVEKSFEKILSRFNHFDYFPAMPHARLARFVADHDLYVFPSLEDGFPNTLVQAMAAGLVPITTQECGPAEYIRSNEEGLLIAKQSADSIENAIEFFIRNPSALVPMREKAIALAQRLTWDNYSSHMKTVVESTIGLPQTTSNSSFISLQVKQQGAILDALR